LPVCALFCTSAKNVLAGCQHAFSVPQGTRLKTRCAGGRRTQCGGWRPARVQSHQRPHASWRCARASRARHPACCFLCAYRRVPPHSFTALAPGMDPISGGRQQAPRENATQCCAFQTTAAPRWHRRSEEYQYLDSHALDTDGDTRANAQQAAVHPGVPSRPQIRRASKNSL